MTQPQIVLPTYTRKGILGLRLENEQEKQWAVEDARI